MGLIHTRASKKLDKAQAKLASAERKDLRTSTKATSDSQRQTRNVQLALDGKMPRWMLSREEKALLAEAEKEEA